MTEPTAGAPATTADVSTPAPVTTIEASPAEPAAGTPVDAPDGHDLNVGPVNPVKAQDPADNNKAKAEARAASKEAEAKNDNGLSLQEQTHINSMPMVGTIEDPSGVERIVALDLDSGWTPAPVESDPKVRDAIAARIDALEVKKQERLDLMKVKS